MRMVTILVFDVDERDWGDTGGSDHGFQIEKLCAIAC
jgi:hypothetical protein